MPTFEGGVLRVSLPIIVEAADREEARARSRIYRGMQAD